MDASTSLADPAVRRDPYPFYKWRRATSPAFVDPQLGWYVFSRHDDALEIITDSAKFSNADSLQEGRPVVRGKTDLPGRGVGVALTSDDDPYHSLIRGLVTRAFTPRAVVGFEPTIKELVGELVDAFPRGAVDVPSAIAVPFPARLIGRILGVPDADYPLFKRWSDALMADASFPEDVAAAETASLRTYFRGFVQERRGDLRDDMVSRLVVAERELGHTLPEDEILAIIQVLMVAGNETTTSLITNMLHLLADRPDVWAMLREDRELVDVAIEETLRFESPSQLLGRRPVSDVAIGGMDVPAGAQVIALIGSANRDEEVFTDSETFRVDRGRAELRRLLSFGYRTHYCIGASLTRLETKLLMNELLDRYREVRRAGESVVKIARMALYSYERLPLEFVA